MDLDFLLKELYFLLETSWILQVLLVESLVYKMKPKQIFY